VLFQRKSLEARITFLVYEEHNHEPVDEGIVQMIVDAGGKLYPSIMPCDMYKLTKDSFIDGCSDILTADEFIDLTEGAQIIFI
jgi:peroxiredoxin family protein